MTVFDFVLVNLVGIAAGWLWCDPSAHFLDPLKALSSRALYKITPPPPDSPGVPGSAVPRRHGRRGGAVVRWIINGNRCPPCVGAYAVTGSYFALAYPLAWDLPVVVLAATALHVMWQKLAGALLN